MHLISSCNLRRKLRELQARDIFRKYIINRIVKAEEGVRSFSKKKMLKSGTWLAQLVEYVILDLRVVSLSPMSGGEMT